MAPNEYVVLFIINSIVILFLNLTNYKESVVQEFKSFFNDHVYTVIPPLLQNIIGGFFNALFDYLLLNEKLNKKIFQLYEKMNVQKYIVSFFFFFLELCVHFILLTFFYIYFKQILTIVSDINKTYEERSYALILFVVGFIIYKLLKNLISHFDTFIKPDTLFYNTVFLCVLILIIFGFYSILSKNKIDYFDNIYDNLSETDFFMNTLHEMLAVIPYLFMAAFVLYVVLLSMIHLYDFVFQLEYNETKEKKLQVLYVICLTLVAAVTNVYVV